MAVKYKLLQTRGKLPKNATLRVVASCHETIGLKTIQQHIQAATALTQGDVAGALIALQEELVHQLKQGNRVHLPGLGYFSVAVTGDVYEDPRSHHFRLRHPRVRTINFQPDKEMKDAMRDMEFENDTYRSQDFAIPSAENVETVLHHLFAEQPVITVSHLRRALALSKTYAYELAKKLEETGRLRNIGSPHRKLFVRGEG